MPVTMYVVRNPFVLVNKTYLPKQEISSTLFATNPNLEKMLLAKGFIALAGAEEVKPVVAKKEEGKPLPVKQMEAPKSIEIKTDMDLKKIIEKTPEPPKVEAVKPETKEEVKVEEVKAPEVVAETPIEEAPKTKGRVSRK